MSSIQDENISDSMEILPVTSPVSSHRKPSYKIQTQNLSYKIQTMYDEFDWVICNKFPRRSPKYILKDVNCEALPGEITAIAGPSGAGKTTLLEILAGKIPATKVSGGQVLINGCPMDGKRFRRLSGYVTQDDALFPLLTVKETLVYSALLRLKGGRKEAEVRAKKVIKELGLDHVAGSRIGEGTSGVSGGERRRVSIGVELVHDPAVILIDEPTSGLDSASALHIISLLKSMVENQSKTIVLTIHQPGFRILNLFNRLVLLSNGYVFHNGSLKLLEERLTFFGYSIPPHINILEFAVDVTSSLIIRSSDRQNTSDITTTRSPKIQKNHNLSYPNSPFEEILILSQRFFKNIFRTKELFLTRILQALVTGLILGTIFMNAANNQDHLALQTRIGFFAFSLSFLLSSSTEGLPIFLQERRIFMRETSRGAYRVSSYVIANTLIFLPFLLLVGLLYTTSVYFLVGLRREFDGFAYFVLVVWMVIMMSNSFTACFSALVPNFIMGTSVISGLMGSFFLFSGYFISKENIPSYWIFMHYLSLFKYPFECFMINQYGGNEGKLKCVQSEEGECTLYGDGFLKEQGLIESQKWSNLGVMLSFIIGYRVVCYLILWCRCYKTRN